MLNVTKQEMVWYEFDCSQCAGEMWQMLEAEGKKWSELSQLIPSRMYLCPECGNKRCPKATFHENDCTGSNERGQKGSAYQ